MLLFPAHVFAQARSFNPEPMLAQASALLDQGRFLECLDAYHAVYRFSRDSHHKAFGLVRTADVLALFLEEKDQALEVYERAVTEFPPLKELENAYFNSGMLLYELGRLPEAGKKFADYARLYPRGRHIFTVNFMAERVHDELEAGAAPKPLPEAAVPEGLVDEPDIRVALAKDLSVTLTFQCPVRAAYDGGTERLGQGTYTFRADASGIFLDARALGKRVVLSPEQGKFSLKGTAYGGDMVLLHEKSDRAGQILAVNQLSLETYLLGVVPKEMSPSWDQEALRSQAVAARSYAYFLLLKSRDKPYDVSATTASQVYGGADAGNAATASAVSATRGQMLFYGGKPVLAYFHAHSGGVLEDDKQVWTADLPYFEVKDDKVSQQFKPVDWECLIPAGSVSAALEKAGFSGERVVGLSADEVSASGRMATVRVDAGENPIVLKSNSLRIMLGPTKMKSTLCTVQKKGDKFYFHGLGPPLA